MSPSGETGLRSLIGDLLRMKPGMNARIQRSLYIPTKDKDDIMKDYQNIIDKLNDALERSSGRPPISSSEKKRREDFLHHLVKK